ncbi:MAG: sigma-70 family RNA polymerase sigma factor [Clostridia bacterium]|nr:sigma-70 family RNA polymerase sigma factor [Clostridia bacterium]
MNDSFSGNAEKIARAKAGDESALDELMRENAGLVRAAAKRFLNRGAEFDDLCQIGSIGMLKAVRRFEPERGTRFSTYAVPLIIGEIRRFLRDDGSVKVGRELKRRSGLVMAETERFTAENGREPTVSELAEICGLTREETAESIGAASAPISLFDTLGELTVEERIGADFTPETDERLALEQAMGCLNEEEKRIIALRYYKNLTQAQTGKVLGISQVTVSRRESAALEKLRKELC